MRAENRPFCALCRASSNRARARCCSTEGKSPPTRRRRSRAGSASFLKAQTRPTASRCATSSPAGGFPTSRSSGSGRRRTTPPSTPHWPRLGHSSWPTARSTASPEANANAPGLRWCWHRRPLFSFSTNRPRTWTSPTSSRCSTFAAASTNPAISRWLRCSTTSISHSATPPTSSS